MTETFRIGLTRDFLNADGTVGFGDIGLGLLDGVPGVTWEFLAENTRELRADQIAGYDALACSAPRITAATLDGRRPAGGDRPLRRRLRQRSTSPPAPRTASRSRSRRTACAGRWRRR